MSTNFLLSKVCLQCPPTMFCLYSSSLLSRPQFEFSLKVKVNNGIESRLPFKIFSTLFKIFLHYIYHDNPPSQYSPLTGILLTKNNYCQISRYLPIAIFCGAFQTYPGLCRSCMNTSLFIGLIKNFKSRKKIYYCIHTTRRKSYFQSK